MRRMRVSVVSALTGLINGVKYVHGAQSLVEICMNTPGINWLKPLIQPIDSDML